MSHAAPAPGRETEFAPIRPVLPDGLRLALLPRLLDCLAPAGTALLLADRADSRTLCAAQVLAERLPAPTAFRGAGTGSPGRQLLRQLGLHRRGSRRRYRDLRAPGSGGLRRYLTPDCARRQRWTYIWRGGKGPAPEEPLLAALHRARRGGCRMWVSNPQETLDIRSIRNYYYCNVTYYRYIVAAFFRRHPKGMDQMATVKRIHNEPGAL